VRRERPRETGGALTLRLPYRAPYDFTALLAFFARRAIPGIEIVDAASYVRRFALGSIAGTLRVTQVPGESALALAVDFPDATKLQTICARVRRMFDLDADIAAINTQLRADKRLRGCVRRHAGQRLPGGWDGFEIAVRAVLGQQISVAAARTFAARIVEQFGVPVMLPDGENVQLFPAPQTLADADLTRIGLPRARAHALNAIARAVCDKAVSFRPEQTLDQFVASWVELPGIGEWTAHYMAMRALSHPDAFPAADLVLRKAVTSDGSLAPLKLLHEMAERWRPWRAYAVMHLWRGLA
jgi:AraC family transcriptional regulator of adaptative response / DNA-3-methyladenine glycosylase II